MVLFQLRKGQVKESQVLNILSQYSYVNLYKVRVVQLDLSDPCPGIFWQELLSAHRMWKVAGLMLDRRIPLPSRFNLGVNLVQLVLVEIKCLELLLMAINKEVIRSEVIRSQVMLVQDRTKTCMLSQPH